MWRLETETTDPTGHTTLIYSEQTVERSSCRVIGQANQFAVRFSDGTYQVFSVVQDETRPVER